MDPVNLRHMASLVDFDRKAEESLLALAVHLGLREEMNSTVQRRQNGEARYVEHVGWPRIVRASQAWPIKCWMPAPDKCEGHGEQRHERAGRLRTKVGVCTFGRRHERSLEGMERQIALRRGANLARRKVPRLGCGPIASWQQVDEC